MTTTERPRTDPEQAGELLRDHLGRSVALSAKEPSMLDVPPLQCRQCLHKGEPFLSWQEFANATIHLRAECRECGAYIQYVPQIEPWIDVIEPWEAKSLT